MTRPSRVMVLRSILFAAAVVLTGACGGRHTAHGDGEPDSEADADADWDQDEAPVPDGDALADVITDGDEAVDADRDWDPEPTTWLQSWPPSATPWALTAAEAADRAGIFVSGASDSLPWAGRLDGSGVEVWSSSIRGVSGAFVLDLVLTHRDSVAVVPTQLDGSYGLVELDAVSGVLRSQVSLSLGSGNAAAGAYLGSLGDGTVVIAMGSPESGVEVARYSFDDGVLWSRLLVDDDYLGSRLAISVGQDDTVFLSWAIGSSAWHGSVVAALGSDGELLWARRTISEECGGLVWGVAATEDGGVVLAGHGSGAACGVWLAKLDEAGAEEWAIFVGDYIEGMFDLSDGEAAFGVAVGSAGEVLAVGLTTDGAPPNRQDALALWVEPTGDVRRMVRIQDVEGARESTASVAAAVPGGGWLVGGVHYSGIPFVAGLDAQGRLDHDCEYIHEVSLPARSVPLGGAFLDLPVEEGSLVVGDSDLVVEETRTTAERLCD